MIVTNTWNNINYFQIPSFNSVDHFKYSGQRSSIRQSCKNAVLTRDLTTKQQEMLCLLRILKATTKVDLELVPRVTRHDLPVCV